MESGKPSTSKSLTLRVASLKPFAGGTAASDLPPFTYSPLPPGTIRLLQPGSSYSSRETEWRIETVALTADVKFDALSYSWGSQKEHLPISLNDRCFHVHRNLYTALPYLATRRRRKFQRHPIWIDAICLNQKDGEEITRQVTLMHQIYRQATIVWVWFGPTPAQDFVPDAIQLLSRIQAAGSKNMQPRHQVGRDSEANAGLNGLQPELWHAVLHILCNPWFRRIWIIQEAALAKRLVFFCGASEIKFNTLIAIIERAQYIRPIDALGKPIEIESFGSHDVFETRNAVQESLVGPELPMASKRLMYLSSIVSNQYRQCLLPEDCVRGLLGLLPIAPTVHQDISNAPHVEIVFIVFTRYLLSTADANDEYRWWGFLRLAFKQPRALDLPSWVPDFYHDQRMLRTYTQFPINVYRFFKHPGFRASPRQTRHKVHEQRNELLVLGHIVSKVAQLLAPIPGNDGDLDELDRSAVLDKVCRIADWVDTADAILDRREKTHDPAKVHPFWRILLRILDNKNDEEYAFDTMTIPSTSYSAFRAGLLLAKSTACRCNGPEQISPHSMSPSQWKQLRTLYELGAPRRAHASFQGKHFFCTADGMFGFTTEGFRPGDMVCIFGGAPTPHVIRRVGGDSDLGDEKWRFVGDAYVHGLMFGEADDINTEVKMCMV